MSQNQLEMSLVFGLFGIALLAFAFYRMRIHRKIADTPTSKIATAPQGYVEVQGFAWPVEKSTTLASGRESVYYSLEIQRLETRGIGKNKRKEWVTVFLHEDSNPFYVVDETGLALVNFENSKTDLKSAEVRHWSKVPPLEQQNILSLVGPMVSGLAPASGWLGYFAAPYRILEKKIFVGSPVYLNGDFSALAQGLTKVQAQGLTEFSQRVFNQESRSKKNVVRLLDKNGDGKVSEDEAQLGYSMAGTMARRRQSAPPESDFMIHGCLGSSHTHQLMLSDVHQEHLLKRMQYSFILPFVAGAACLSFALIHFVKH